MQLGLCMYTHSVLTVLNLSLTTLAHGYHSSQVDGSAASAREHSQDHSAPHHGLEPTGLPTLMPPTLWSTSSCALKPMEWLLIPDPWDLQDTRLSASQAHPTLALIQDPYPRVFLMTLWGLSPAHPAGSDVQSRKHITLCPAD